MLVLIFKNQPKFRRMLVMNRGEFFTFSIQKNIKCSSFTLFQHLFLLFGKSGMTDSIHSEKAPEPVGHYPHAKRVGNLLFLSGIGPRERGNQNIPGVELDENGAILSYDIEKQCHSVFKNVKSVLEEAGSSWEKIVDVTVYLTNMKDDFQTYNRLWAAYFAENPPCRTTLEINCLPTPIAIELKVMATLD